MDDEKRDDVNYRRIHIGERVRAASRSCGITMGDMARLLGCDVSRVYGIERGELVPSDAEAARIEKLTGVPSTLILSAAEHRDESMVPHVWIDIVRVREVALEGCDCVGHMSAKKVLPNDVEYIPASELESSESARKLAVEETAESRHAADAMREKLEAAQRRVAELELLLDAARANVEGQRKAAEYWHANYQSLLTEKPADG